MTGSGSKIGIDRLDQASGYLERYPKRFTAFPVPFQRWIIHCQHSGECKSLVGYGNLIFWKEAQCHAIGRGFTVNYNVFDIGDAQGYMLLTLEECSHRFGEEQSGFPKGESKS